MKAKAKELRLQKRIAEWEKRGNPRHDMHRPGSRKK